MPADEARRQALIALAERNRRKSDIGKRAPASAGCMLQDLRYGVRQLLKSPGFTKRCRSHIGVGIAVNARCFSMVSAFLLRRPPCRDPERVVVISSINPGRVSMPTRIMCPPPTICMARSKPCFRGDGCRR